MTTIKFYIYYYNILNGILNEFVIDGIKTTIPFFQEIITQKDFLNGSYDINWLEKYKETN